MIPRGRKWRQLLLAITVLSQVILGTLLRLHSTDHPEEYWSNVSETARNFVSTCLTVDPAIHPTADQMLQHSWLTVEVPHSVEAENGEPTDLLPHVRKAFNARRTCMLFSFCSARCILTMEPIHAVRKAVFSMVAIKRMAMLAHDHHQLSHLSPEQRQLDEVFQLKQESEKASLEHADVLHHHNADLSRDEALHHNASSEHTGQSRIEEQASVVYAPIATGSDPSSDHVPSVTPAETVKKNKEVTEKLATVSLAASAKVSVTAAKRA